MSTIKRKLLYLQYMRNKRINFKATEEERQAFTDLANKLKKSKTALFYEWLEKELQKEGMTSLKLISNRK